MCDSLYSNFIPAIEKKSSRNRPSIQDLQRNLLLGLAAKPFGSAAADDRNPACLTAAFPDFKMGDMRRKAVFAKALFILVVAALLLPATICIVVALASLLAAMHDETGGATLRYVALAAGVLWVVDLVAIVLVQAIDALVGPDDGEQ
jgi:hypothetical protein